MDEQEPPQQPPQQQPPVDYELMAYEAELANRDSNRRGIAAALVPAVIAIGVVGGMLYFVIGLCS